MFWYQRKPITIIFLGLLLVILGTGLLKPNVSTIVGSLYSIDDDRRDSGFTIFYMGINLGGLLGPLIVGGLGQNPDYGWHWGFGAAGVGMLFGVIQFWWTRRYLGTSGLYPASSGDDACWYNLWSAKLEKVITPS